MKKILAESLIKDFKCKHNLIGGGKLNLSISDYYINLRRLFTLHNAVCRAVFFVCFLVLSVACQKATLVPSEQEGSSRGKDNTTKETTDSTTVKPELDINGWDEAINADFTFSGVQQEGGNE